jgi:lipoprotein NlpI
MPCYRQAGSQSYNRSIPFGQFSSMKSALQNYSWHRGIPPFAAVLIGLLLWFSPRGASGADIPVEEYLRKARLAFHRGERQESLDLLNKALELEPANLQALYHRARVYESLRDHAKSIADYDQIIRLDPRSPQVYQLRGFEHFRATHIKESIADFDKSIELFPSQAPHHWQRGISYYYAKQYGEGRRQFETHQTVNSSDVENAVWHFLCVTGEESFEKARASLIAIKGDQRVPMMEIFALFAGKGTVDQVLAAAEAGAPPPDEFKQRLFYAHLYLGLYFEAMGNAAKSEEHMAKAVGPYAVDHYMGDVARVHVKLRNPAAKP